MPEPYPNQFLSIPQSIVSLKHYFRVYDQPFRRSLMYLGVIALAIAAIGAATDYFRHHRSAAAEAKTLTEKLADVHLADGQARIDPKELPQPATLWKGSSIVLVADTTGKVDNVGKAMDYLGCPNSARFLFFGPETVLRVEEPSAEKEKAEKEKAEKGKGAGEEIPYTDAAKLAEVRKLLETHGGKMPDIKLVDGKAEFSLGPKKLYILVQNPALLAIADTSGKKRSPRDAVFEAIQAEPELHDRFVPPEFLALLTAKEAQISQLGQKEVATWALSEESSAASLAEHIAAAVRNVRTQSIFPNAVTVMVCGSLILFVFSLMFSVAGMMANALVRANLAYVELLTISIYAVTPAAVVSLIAAVLLQGRGGSWPLLVPFIVGISYTAMGVHRVGRELALSGASGAPQL